MTDNMISNAIARSNATAKDIRGPCDDPLSQALLHERDELRIDRDRWASIAHEINTSQGKVIQEVITLRALTTALEALNDDLRAQVKRLETRLATAGVNPYKNEED